MLQHAALAFPLAPVAGKAKCLEPGREPVADKPVVEAVVLLGIAEQLAAVLGTVSVDVIDRQPLGGAAAGAPLAVVGEYLIPGPLSTRTVVLAASVGVVLPPLAGHLPGFLRVGLLPAARVLIGGAGVICPPLAVVCGGAFPASASMTVRRRTLLDELSQRLNAAARVAAFRGRISHGSHLIAAKGPG